MISISEYTKPALTKRGEITSSIDISQHVHNLEPDIGTITKEIIFCFYTVGLFSTLYFTGEDFSALLIVAV